MSAWASTRALRIFFVFLFCKERVFWRTCRNSVDCSGFNENIQPLSFAKGKERFALGKMSDCEMRKFML